MPVQLRGQHRGRSFCDRPAPERGNACLFVSKAITETAILQVDVQDALVFTGAFTIQCWVRPTTDTTQFHTIFSLGNRVCFTEHTLKVDPFDLHSDSIMWRTDYLVVGSNQEFSLSSYFPADAWRLCTLCRDTSSTVRVFVGTTNIRTWNNVGNSLGALHNVGLWIGSRPGSAPQDRLVGWIDDFRIIRGLSLPPLVNQSTLAPQKNLSDVQCLATNAFRSNTNVAGPMTGDNAWVGRPGYATCTYPDLEVTRQPINVWCCSWTKPMHGRSLVFAW